MASICVGCGLAVNGSGVLIVDRNPDSTASGLDCADADGLSLAIQHISGGCVDLTGLGTSGSPLHADINLGDAPNGLLCGGDGLRVDRSEDGFNSLEIRGNGLFARCPTSYAATKNTGYEGGTFPIGLNTGGAGTFSVQSDGGVFSMTNGTPWQMQGFYEFRAYGGCVRANPGFDGYAYLESSTDGAGFIVAQPATNFRMDNRTRAAGNPNAGVVDFEPSGLVEKNWIVFNPGQTITMKAALTIHVYAGTATWLDNAPGPPRFEFYGHITNSETC